ncbi:MAG: helix-turn-helix transcriptional regulator [Dongiaceae bacterium]
MNPGGGIDDDTHHGASVVPAFYRIRDVIRMTALTRTTLYRRILEGRFPPPVHLGGRTCGWSRAALQAWIADPERYHAPQISGPPARRPRGRPRKYIAS